MYEFLFDFFWGWKNMLVLKAIHKKHPFNHGLLSVGKSRRNFQSVNFFFAPPPGTPASAHAWLYEILISGIDIVHPIHFKILFKLPMRGCGGKAPTN